MCGMCADVIGGCSEIECGALPPRREDGTRRWSYMRWYTLGQVPCRHVVEGHGLECALRMGRDCDCRDD